LNKVAEKQSRNEHDMMRQSHAEYVLRQIALRSCKLQLRNQHDSSVKISSQPQ
jgi:hypothetical protein